MEKTNQSVLMSSIAKFVLGESTNVKIKSKSEKKIKATLKAAKATKSLYNALNNSASTLDGIMKLVEHKNLCAKRFEKITGINWEL